ncbi:MAG: choice-of-anchor D domain-containing protein [Bacteroidales bacterium]|nr:choice-of-anchor D domain-containing protein [Bacteroidales bacterium]
MKNVSYSRRFFIRISLVISCTLMLLGQVAVTQPVMSGGKDWSIVASYDIPGKASGLAFDGQYLYFGIYGTNGDKVYRFDPATGVSSLLFSNPTINDSYGMTFDGANLWITDHGTSSSQPAYALELDFTGSVISQFNLPDHYMSGIAYDNGDFWVATYYPDPGTIYKVDNTGTVISQIPSPNSQPWDLCLQGTDLWVADYNADMLYRIDQTGAILESHLCDNDRPAGVVHDGQYLWYVDGPLSANSRLYKVDLGGTGTPQIQVPVTSYNFGNVAVGDSVVWYCTVNSTGTADLEITALNFPSAVPIFLYMTFPQVIPPGNFLQIPIIYRPTEPGPLSTTLTIVSNDPVTPEVDLTVSGTAVFSGPHINITTLSHDWGSVRMNAHTRWFLEILNDGSQMLEISDIQISDPHFYLDPGITFPIQVPVMVTHQVGIWFNPDQAVSYSGTAGIISNAPGQSPFDIALSGAGIDQDWPMGSLFWYYTITTSYDNSPKAMGPIPDITGDGVDDVIICSEDGYVRCFNGNAHGLGDILWENEAGSVYQQNDLAFIEDIDNDGYPDVIVGLVGGVRAIKVLSGKTGQQIWIYDTHVYGTGGWVYQVWSGYDYDNDGTDDVLASTGNDGTNTGPKRIFCLNGLSGVPIWECYTNGPNFSVIGVEDFNNDNIPDVIGGASNLNETEGKIYGINGTNGGILWTYSTGGTSVWALGQLDDINNDGLKDVVAGDFAGNFYLIDPVAGSVVYSGAIGPYLILRVEMLDDVNNDGFRDFSFGSSRTSIMVISGANGQNIWLQSTADKAWNIDRIGDVSGDGINDLIVGTLYSNNYCYFFDGTDGTVLYSVNYGQAVDAICAIPDINGDGSPEMVAGGRNGKVNCLSGGINAATPGIKFDVKLFLEGPYQGTEMTTFLNGLGFIPLNQPYNSAPWNYNGTESVAAIPNAGIVDWILMEFRETPGDVTTATSSTMVARQAAFLLKDGTVRGLDGNALPQLNITVTENLYLVIWTRNHLSVISAVPLPESAGIYSWDYASASAQAYGGILAQKELAPGVWGLIAGDADANGQVSNQDKVEVWAPQSGSSGYLQGDFDLNGNVNNQDKIDLWVPNSGSGSQVPG